LAGINELLTLTVQRDASDLHLNPGRPPVGRIDGALVSMTENVLDDAGVETLAREVCSEGQWNELQEVGSTDFGLAHESGNRFRVSVYRQRGRYSAVMRLIPSELLSFDQIGLPAAVQELLRRPRGLVLVTGPTGSGKIEDPIEYYHGHGLGLVSQREVGADVPNFPEALRRALRQDPDVILLGEMRDLDTISAAVTAAETGHLVFGTLHTTGSARTVNRLIDAFPSTQQEQIRAQLSVSLVAVVSQVLLPKIGGGRVAAFEVMLMTPAIANLIRKNETAKIQSTIQTSRRMGMVTLDDSLLDLVRRGVIEVEVALDHAQDRSDLESRL
jgi:twitching motility protein PilT